jgi:hypothetical protein
VEKATSSIFESTGNRLATDEYRESRLRPSPRPASILRLECSMAIFMEYVMREEIYQIVEFSLPTYAVFLLACLVVAGTAALIGALLICLGQNQQTRTLRRRLDRQSRHLDQAAESEQEKEILGRRLAYAEAKLSELAESLRGVWQ